MTWAAYRRGEDESSVEEVFGNFFQLSIWAVFLQGMLQVQATLSNPLGRSTLAFPSRAFVRSTVLFGPFIKNVLNLRGAARRNPQRGPVISRFVGGVRRGECECCG